MTDNDTRTTETERERLIDDAAYGVMEGINEGGHSWDDEDRMRQIAEYHVTMIGLNDEAVEEIIETARERYAPTDT